MHPHLERLIEILKQELQLHRKLQGLLRAEQEALVALKSDALLEAAREKDAVALQLRALEEARRLVMESLALEFSLPAGEQSTLSELIQRIPDHYALRLSHLRSELREVVEHAQTENDANRFLVNRSLELVREAMQALAQADEKPHTYHGKRMAQAYQSAPQVITRQV